MIMFLHVLFWILPLIIRTSVFKINHTSIGLAFMMVLPDAIDSLDTEAKIIRTWRAGIERQNYRFSISSLNLCSNNITLLEFNLCIGMISPAFGMIYNIPVQTSGLGGY